MHAWALQQSEPLLLLYPLHIGVVNSRSTSRVHGLQEGEPCRHEPPPKRVSQHMFPDHILGTMHYAEFVAEQETSFFTGLPVQWRGIVNALPQA